MRRYKFYSSGMLLEPHDECLNSEGRWVEFAEAEAEIALLREELDKSYLAVGRLNAKCAVLIAHLATLAREGDSERSQRVLKAADAESERVRLEDRVSVTLNAARSGEES